MEVGKKKKKVVVLCSRFPQKVQRRQRNVQKSVMRVQSSCFACLNLFFFFFAFSLPSPLSLLKLPNCLTERFRTLKIV